MNKDILIKKWLNDELNDTEKVAFEKLDDAQINLAILENAKYFKASNFLEVDDFNTFKQHYYSQKQPAKKLFELSTFLKIAGVLVIAFGVYFAFFFNNETQIKTLAGEKTTVELPDKSQVFLNALSSIEYNESKWKDKRLLKLYGEAYFKVAKGKKFDVVTSSGIVTVVGTKFNVKQRLNYFEVKCFEGIVRVSSNTIERLLHAGDTYQILNNTFIESKTTAVLPKWTTNLSDFEAIPFKEVLAELERQYNIQIKSEDVNTNRLFTGGFVHNNLENALIAITQPMNITYELSSSNQVVIRGKNK